jgi:hypothetical protein
VEGLRDRAAGIAGGGHEDCERPGHPFDSTGATSSRAGLAQGKQPRERARAEILEGECWSVKQLDHAQLVVKLHDRNGKIQRVTNQ